MRRHEPQIPLFLAVTMALGLAMLIVGGCGRRTTAAEIERNSAEARAGAARDLAYSRNGAAASEDVAWHDTRRQTQGSHETTADPDPGTDANSNYPDRIVTAEIAYRIAVDRCRTAAGPARRACRNAADAAVFAEKANAAQARS